MAHTTVADSHIEVHTDTGVPTGKLGVWWFLASEIPTFGGLIACYILMRLGSTGWVEEAAHLSIAFPLMNTLVLLTSSMTMVMAHAAVGKGDQKELRTFLLLTVLMGVGFLGLKAAEYTVEMTHGFFPSSGPGYDRVL